MQQKETNLSKLEVKKIGDISSLTGSLVLKPLKTFAIQRGPTCQIVFSNYGGGYVEGDEINLALTCLHSTTTLLSSQANTRIYKSIHGGITRQTIQVTQEDDSFVAYIGDALVTQKESIFEQKFHWKMGKRSVLLFVDWFQAGRILNEERFDFTSFGTEFRAEDENGLHVLDRFRIRPSQHNVNSPGAFLDHTGYLNVFLVGNETLEKVQVLENHLRLVAKKHFREDAPLRMHDFGLIGASSKVNKHVFLLRCSFKENELVAQFVRDLTSVLEMKELLGFQPMERKY